jgi:hypothetical protein
MINERTIAKALKSKGFDVVIENGWTELEDATILVKNSNYHIQVGKTYILLCEEYSLVDNYSMRHLKVWENSSKFLSEIGSLLAAAHK